MGWKYGKLISSGRAVKRWVEGQHYSYYVRQSDHQSGMAHLSKMSALQLDASPSGGNVSFTSRELRIAVVFSQEVLTHFESHRQIRRSQPEVGGQLFAELRGDEVHIVRVTGPHSTDRKGCAWFRPNQNRQNREIGALFKVGLHFVGDWHTHPEKIPEPSRLDLDSMADSYEKSRHQLRAFIMVIVGQVSAPAGLWVGLHSSSTCERLYRLT